MKETRKIIRREPGNGTEKLPQELNPVLRRIYAARGITCPDELDSSFEYLHCFSTLLGIDAATDLLVEALEKQSRLLIVADFDADGATSCATAVRALTMFGFEHVDYLVPNRFEYGYGLTPEIVEVAAQRTPDLIITVDNGISSFAGVDAAHDRGIKVLVTDHHLPGQKLPEADAIVNPNQPGDDFPGKNLAGVGVIFYVMLALRARLRKLDWFARHDRREPNLGQLLDLVALGTVADVVPLDHINRILVAQGLQRMRRGRCCPGILALLEIARRDWKNIVAADMGFAVGPRLNAAGRLEDMSLGIECLLTDDPNHALEIAQQLDLLNKERREIETEMKEQALASLANLPASVQQEDRVCYCLFDETWHQGVIGIVAGRIKERLHRPVIAFALAGENELKGSARSIPGLHIRDILDAVATRHPGLLSKFGGHAMAAGLSLPRDHLEPFRQAFEEEVARHAEGVDLEGVVYSDGELDDGQLDLPLAETLRNAGPWGQGFPEPVFDGVFNVTERRIVGEHHLKLRVSTPGNKRLLDAIAFNQTDAAWPDDTRQVRMAYKLDVNEFRGQRSAQLVVELLQPVDVQHTE
jgi:single-stranded-DNA-specific exonuclease